eukprot:209961-Pleurochrysis_carterae.AAC.1
MRKTRKNTVGESKGREQAPLDKERRAPTLPPFGVRVARRAYRRRHQHAAVTSVGHAPSREQR